MPRLALLARLSILLALAACHRARPVPAQPRDSIATYEVRGILREASPGQRRARISHEAIPGYMEAMTMEFEVAEPAALAEFQAGDPLVFRLSVTEKHGWIDRLRRLDQRPVVPSAPEIAAAPADALAEKLPDCELIDETGRRFHLRDYAGQPLAITFIFTRCPFPDFCPRMNERFVETQGMLNPDLRGHLFSISLDPEYDTPERLAEYSTRIPRDPLRWTFATGARADIRVLGSAVGLVVLETAALPEHNLRTVIVDAQGRVRKILPNNDWTAADLTAELVRADTRKP